MGISHSMESHSMEKVPIMENFSINQKEHYTKYEVFGNISQERAPIMAQLFCCSPVFPLIFFNLYFIIGVWSHLT